MRKIFVPLILLIILPILFSGCAPQSVIYKSEWQSAPLVSGNSSDYLSAPLRYTDPKTQLNFSVLNDSTNLYILINCTDETTINGITQRGFQMWIDTTGKKNHQVGIMCPIPQKNAYASGNNNKKNYRYDEQQNSPDSMSQDTAKENQMYRNYREGTKQMHVSGFKNVPDGNIDLVNSYGINLVISWYNSKLLTYEATIPLKTFFNYPLLPSDTAKIIGISFNFTITPQRNYNSGGNDGFSPGIGFGGMGFGGMGMMVGMGGGGRGGGTSSPEPETIWTRFRLSVK